MKLLNKTTNYYLLTLIPIFLVSCILFFLVAKKINILHVDRNLKEDKQLIIEHTKTDHPKFIESELSHDFYITHIPKDQIIIESIKTIEEYDSLVDEIKPYRQLTTSIEYDGRRYEIILRKSLVENSTFLYSLSVLILLLMGLSIGIFLYLKRIISKKLWSPFYNSLKDVKRFEVGHNMSLCEVNTDIDEFNELHNTLDSMTKRIEKDYARQKEFIDIVSHELQTPIAVISLHIENIIQSDNLSQDLYKEIQVIQDTVYRITKMNKALLLISKIKNYQFVNKKKVFISEVIDAQLKLYEDFISEKGLIIEKKIDDSVTLYIDPMLAEILISNLLQNAIRHNVSGGKIIVTIKDDLLCIENSGERPKINTSEVFEKFIKSDKKDSTGLGLSIVKGICETMAYKIQFDYNEVDKTYTMILSNIH